MICPNCGTKLPEGSVYCMECGARFRYANTSDRQKYIRTATETERRKKRRLIVILCASAVIVVAAALVLLYSLRLSSSARFDRRMELADSYYSTGVYSDAADEYRKAAGLRPDSAGAHFGLASALAASGDEQGAKAELLAVTELDPAYPGAYAALMGVYMELSDWRAALGLISDGLYSPSEAGYEATLKKLEEACLLDSGYSEELLDFSALAAMAVRDGASAGGWAIRNGVLYLSVTLPDWEGETGYSFSSSGRSEIFTDAARWEAGAGPTSGDWTDILNVRLNGTYADIILDSYEAHLRSLGVLSSTLSGDIDGDGDSETVYVTSDYRATWSSGASSGGDTPGGEPLTSGRSSGVLLVIADIAGGELVFRPVAVTETGEIVAETYIADGLIYLFTRANIYTCAYTGADGTAASPCLDSDRRDNVGSRFVWRYAAGEEARHDLDGDGAEDTVLFAPLEDEVLTVNGVCVIRAEGLPDMKQQAFYYITDIDASDGKLEIALPSVNAVLFFSLKDGAALYVGSVGGRVGDDSFALVGNGSVSGSVKLGLLQTWEAPGVWRFGADGTLAQTEQELYYPKSSAPGSKLTAKKSFDAFKSNDLESGDFEVRKDERLTLTATDGVYWVRFTTASGVTGWLYLPDSVNVLTGGETVSPSKLFSGLN